LGSEEFVERVLADAEERVRAQVSLDRTRGQVQEYIQKQCAERGVKVVEVRGGSRRGAVAHLRAELARHLVIECGLPMAEAARQLGVTTSGIARALTRIGAT
jgi:hypothetical protein